MSAEWSSDEIAKASAMWTEGHPISSIATDVGKSRSSVAGYMNRNRDKFPKSGQVGVGRMVKQRKCNPKPSAPRPKKEAVARPRKQRLPSALKQKVSDRLNFTDSATGESRVKPFVELSSDECHWFLQSLGEAAGPQTPCCGATALLGSRYCHEHHHRVYEKPVWHKKGE